MSSGALPESVLWVVIAFTPKVLRIGDSEIIGKEIVSIKFLNFTENVDRSNFQKFACF